MVGFFHGANKQVTRLQVMLPACEFRRLSSRFRFDEGAGNRVVVGNRL
jgi:hypothetical protein